MSYDEFPDEYAILKRSLEQEDYDRAESVLLMILKNKPDFQQAQLDLERVRGKLGSISNYEFRVKAFLDQGELSQAERILEEAGEKFTENRKIKALIAHYEKLAGKSLGAGEAGGSGSAGAPPAPGPTPPPPPGTPQEEEDDLPNLQTFIVDESTSVPGAGGSSPAGGKVTPGSMPGFGGGGGGAGSGASPAGGGGGARAAVLGAGGGASPAKASDGGSSAAPTGGEKGSTVGPQQSPTTVTKRGTNKTKNRSGTKLTYGDTIHRRMDTIVVACVWALVLLLFGGLIGFLGVVQSERLEPPEVGELPDSARQLLEPMIGTGPQDEAQKQQLVRLYHQTLGNPEQYPDVEVVVRDRRMDLTLVEAYYRAFVRIGEHTPAIDVARVDAWRTAAYERQDRIPPIDPEWLEGTQWDPEASPPKFGLAGVWQNTIELVLAALFVALLPGLLLGIALAYCTMPLLNRLFDALWELWFALPLVALLYLGYAGLAGLLGVEPSASFAALLVGLAMVPHVAFHARQGFENLRPLPAGKQAGLGVLAALAALLASAARFLMEGVLVLAVAGAAVDGPAGQTVGRTVVEGLKGLGVHHLAPETFAAYSMFSLALMLGFVGLAVALGLAVLAQILQMVVAALGLKSNRPAAHELPDAPQQSPIALRNVVAAFLGIVVAVGAGVLLLASHTHATQGVEVAVENSLAAETLEQATRHSVFLALASGIGATLFGLVFALVHTAALSTRRARAWFESAFRVPVALPPVSLALIAFVVLGSTEPSMTLTVLVAVVGLTPLAAVVLMSSFERSRRGPFVPDSEGNLPHGGLLKLARFFEVLGTAAFVSAVAFGSYALVLGIGPSADGAPGFATLPAGLLELTSTAVTSEATHTYYTHLVGGVLVGITASLAARLLAEISARLALLKRG